MGKRGAGPGNEPESQDRPATEATKPPSAARAETQSRPTIEVVLVETFEQIREEFISTLAYVLGNRDDAQDVAQEAFLKCWRARTTLPDVQNLRAWIFRVGLNAARDYQRSGWKKRSKPLIAEEVLLPAREMPITERLEEDENIALLRAAILELRSEEREVFLLRQNGDLTYEQIAEIRNTPVGTVKTQMRTALMKLRTVLNPDPPTDEPVADGVE